AGSSVIAQTATAPFSGSSANPDNLSSASGGAAQTINVVTNPASIVTTIVKGTGGTFILTPTIARIFPGLTVLLNQSVKTEQNLASVEQIQMKFAENGTNVRFSFGVSGSPPSSLPPPSFGISSVPSALALPARSFGISGSFPSALALPTPPISNLVLFLDINSTGQVVQPFSSPAAFESSPSIEILVNKTVDITKLKDGSGCPDIQLSTFNESSANWQTLSKPTRTASIDTPVECGFTLEPGHFSKFAVGGVRSLAPSLL
ncbi:MAG: hypothetical protein M3P08_14895, partial [Thermoproteota archaeon]|nr:hypothetical protein [Thermoproteota archaeon]